MLVANDLSDLRRDTGDRRRTRRNGSRLEGFAECRQATHGIEARKRGSGIDRAGCRLAVCLRGIDGRLSVVRSECVSRTFPG